MSVCTDQPILNFLPQNGARVIIKKAPQMTYNCQQANIPGFRVGAAWQATPFVNIPKSGDKMEFDVFSMSFLVDEQFRNYLEIWNWMREYSKPNNHDEYKSIIEASKVTGMGIYSDIILMPLDSSKNVIGTITIKDAFPIAMSSILFDATLPTPQYVTAQASFILQSFEISI